MEIHDERHPQGKTSKTEKPFKKLKSLSKEGKLRRGFSKSKKRSKDFESDFLQINEDPLPKLTEEGEAVGIITLEDVIEELLQVLTMFLWINVSYSIVGKVCLRKYNVFFMQEEIYDEKDHRNEN